MVTYFVLIRKYGVVEGLPGKLSAREDSCLYFTGDEIYGSLNDLRDLGLPTSG